METLLMAWFKLSIFGILLLEPISTTIVVVGVGVFLIWAGYKAIKNLQKIQDDRNKEEDKLKND